jgi:tRNA pseudouridine55 synthase
VIDSDEGAFFLVKKPIEWTSFDVVNKLRYALKTKKIGHAGTLDPLATGLLIICAGKMTKRIEEFQGLEKEYTGTITLGQTTPSYDLETVPSPAVPIDHLSDESIRNAAQSFVGVIQQVPPAHSSIKVDGKRAYSLARKGKDPALKARQVEIKEFEITGIKKPHLQFRIVCSKGTYIRSLANDLGAALAVGGHLSELCRTRIGPYRLADAETMDSVTRKSFRD